MPDSLSLCQESEKGEILEILNEAIVNTTAIYEYLPRTLESMEAWFALKRAGQIPIVGVFDEHKKPLGFGSYGSFS
jgi:L-amino acid N-acyltransferase